MRLRRASVCGLGVLALGMAGCGMFKRRGGRATAARRSHAAAAEKPAPMSYTQDGNGLPHRAFGSRRSPSGRERRRYPDIGAISRLADGPWIFITDGQGNWRDASNGLPREPTAAAAWISWT
jgi:hypothetical protein